MRHFWALICGLLFSAGLIVSDMVNPASVLGFLDITGEWDPGLGFVMGGAVLVTFVGYRYVLKRPSPFFAADFQVPVNKQVDTRLVAGAATFGVGWGLVGLCPGPAVTAVAAALLGQAPIYILAFFVAMLLGFYAARVIKARQSTTV